MGGYQGQLSMPATESHWRIEDAYVLAALRVSGSTTYPAALFDLIAAYDAMHHMIVTRTDLNHAIPLLASAGLAEVTRAGYFVTENGRGLIATAYATAVAAAHGQADEAARMQVVLQHLQQVPLLTHELQWWVDQGDYEAVTLEYQHAMRAEYRRPEFRRSW